MKKSSSESIFLVEPPNDETMDNRGKAGLPLGVGYVAASLAVRGIRFTFDDLNAQRVNLLFLERRLKELAPGLIGVSCSPWNEKLLTTIFQLLRQVLPECVLVIGGPLVRYQGSKYLEAFPDVDIVVKNEGEDTFSEIAAAYLENRGGFLESLGRITGIAFRSPRGCHETPDRPVRSDLDAYPSPLVHGLFQLEQYGSIVSLLSARGCPFSCIYCQWGSPNLPFRTHSVEYVVAELKVLQRRGIKKVAFGDGTFNFSTKRLQAFLKAFRENDFDFELYDIDCRADLFDEEQAEILEALGVVDVGFGLETVNRHTQRLIRKNLDPDAVARSVNVAKSHGFNVHVSMMVGLPGETREDVIRTVEFLQKVRADYVGVFPVRLQQGTEMARMPEHRIAHRMTKEDITELVEMVRERFSTVVPRHEYYTLRRRLGAFLFN